MQRKAIQTPLASQAEKEAERVTNRSAIRRLFRSELVRLGWVGKQKLPRGGLKDLEEYLEKIARSNIEAFAKRRSLVLLNDWKKEEGGC